MSTATDTPVIPVPITPPAKEAPTTPTAKSMVAEAFGQPAPVATTPKAADIPGKKPEAKEAPAAKTDVKTADAPAKADAPVKKDTPAVEYPEDKLEIPANASPEAVKNFKAYKDSMKAVLTKERAERAAAEKIAADLQTQIAAKTASGPADTAQLETLRTEHKAALDRLAILDLQHHPDFVRQYVEPQKKALADAAEVLGYNEKGNVDLVSLLGKPMKDFNAAVSEFTKDMNTADAATVATSLREARKLHAAEQAALSKSGELSTQLKSKAAQEQKQAFEGAVAEVLPAFKKVEITETMSAEEKQAAVAYNQSIDGVRSRAEARVFGNVSERDVAMMAFKEQAFETTIRHLVPSLQRAIDQRNQTIADLTAQLESVKGSRSPSAGGGDIRTGEGKPPSKEQLVAAAYSDQRM